MLLLCLINHLHVPFLPCTIRLNLIQGQHFQSMFWILYLITLPARIAKMVGYLFLSFFWARISLLSRQTPLLYQRCCLLPLVFFYGESCENTAEGHHHLANWPTWALLFFFPFLVTYLCIRLFSYLIYLALLNYLIMYNGLYFFCLEC